MRKFILGFFIVGLIFHNPAKAQTEWDVKVFGGVSDAKFLGNIWLGAPSVNVDRFQEYGVRGSWKSKSKWGIETGFSYAKATLVKSTHAIPQGSPPPRPASPFHEREEPFRHISFPLLASFHASSFLSFQAGPLLGFQLADGGTWIEQSGIGYLVGVNLHHYFDRLGVFIQPNFKQHAVVGFNQTGVRLTEFGLQIGLAYRLTTRGF